ncbi:EMARD-like protein [Mya arenaria]|uniref:EMARD-like protein n=1 Tax=Mya arenaria TaxID=6604 RepID=A0ABY7FES8_MYAAR|nr:EMARD-like protein [Mya arenaria]
MKNLCKVDGNNRVASGTLVMHVRLCCDSEVKVLHKSKGGGVEGVLAEIWRDMFTHNPVNEVTALLVSSAVLERALGDVYMLKGPAPCPSMLKDLLVTEQLKEILGEHVMCILRLVMGPPTSLNLRNVAWHGFPFPGEIPARCIWFLILLVPSIGRVLEERLVPVLMLHREPVVFPRTKLITEVDILSSKDLIEAVKDTQFSSWDTRMFWTNITSLYTQERYGECTALLLYYLEQGLRLVFATANNCENRILTAEATTLYTTFDENKCVTILHEDIKSYSVQFHRISLLKKEISTFFKKASETDSMILLQPDLSERKPNDPFQSTDEVSSLEAKLRDIVAMQQFATNRQQQMTLKQLRSRQRENFKKFLARFWKSVLKLCENLRTFTHHDKNKWTEGEELNKAVTALHGDIKSYRVQFHRISLLKKEYCDLHNLKSTVDEILQEKIHTLYRNSKCTIIAVGAIFWKSVMQICENLRTFTRHDKNKWTEGAELVYQLYDCIRSNLKQCFD